MLMLSLLTGFRAFAGPKWSVIHLTSWTLHSLWLLCIYLLYHVLQLLTETWTWNWTCIRTIKSLYIKWPSSLMFLVVSSDSYTHGSHGEKIHYVLSVDLFTCVISTLLIMTGQWSISTRKKSNVIHLTEPKYSVSPVWIYFSVLHSDLLNSLTLTSTWT